MNLDELGAETVVFKCFDNSLLVFTTKCFDGHTQLYSSVAVCGNKLVMIEAYNITVTVGYGLSERTLATRSSSPGRSGSSTETVKMRSR